MPVRAIDKSVSAYAGDYTGQIMQSYEDLFFFQVNDLVLTCVGR